MSQFAIARSLLLSSISALRDICVARTVSDEHLAIVDSLERNAHRWCEQAWSPYLASWLSIVYTTLGNIVQRGPEPAVGALLVSTDERTCAKDNNSL